MKNQDRSTKILLGLLVAGVWGLLLKPIVSTSVEAQPSTKAPVRTKAPAKINSATNGKVVLVASEYEGNIILERAKFVARINAYEAKGYKIAGYQTTINGNLTEHYALLERK